jgi:hypothetical protein
VSRKKVSQTHRSGRKSENRWISPAFITQADCLGNAWRQINSGRRPKDFGTAEKHATVCLSTSDGEQGRAWQCLDGRSVAHRVLANAERPGGSPSANLIPVSGLRYRSLSLISFYFGFGKHDLSPSRRESATVERVPCRPLFAGNPISWFSALITCTSTQERKNKICNDAADPSRGDTQTTSQLS